MVRRNPELSICINNGRICDNFRKTPLQTMMFQYCFNEEQVSITQNPQITPAENPQVMTAEKLNPRRKSVLSSSYPEPVEDSSNQLKIQAKNSDSAQTTGTNQAKNTEKVSNKP